MGGLVIARHSLGVEVCEDGTGETRDRIAPPHTTRYASQPSCILHSFDPREWCATLGQLFNVVLVLLRSIYHCLSSDRKSRRERNRALVLRVIVFFGARFCLKDERYLSCE